MVSSFNRTTCNHRSSGVIPKLNSNNEEAKVPFLVLRCQSGDLSAFETLYSFYEPRTFRYLSGLVGPERAKDVRQEVWLSVFQKLATLNNPARFKPWLYRLTRYRAIDSVRSRRKRADTSTLDEVEPSSAQLAISETEEPSDRELDLIHSLAQLSPNHKEVLILKYWEELSYLEISLIIGKKIGTVRSRLHHAKADLKSLLLDGSQSD